MLHHISFGVSDMNRSAKFYDAVLAALGYERVWTDAGHGTSGAAVGYGDKSEKGEKGGGDKFAIKLQQGAPLAPGPGFHLAFAARSRGAVDAFHFAAMQNGGADNGAPGLRPNYGPAYYAAFVVDPDGHHIEAVINTDSADLE